MNSSNKKEAKSQIQDISTVNCAKSERELDQHDLIYGKKLQSPILGHRYQLPDLPTSYVPSIILDTSLLHASFNNNQTDNITILDQISLQLLATLL